MEMIESKITSTFLTTYCGKDWQIASISEKELRTYAIFKTDLKFENYYDFVLNFKVMLCYPQFRLGFHDLKIERRRYMCQLLPTAERLCKLSSLQAVEGYDYPMRFICCDSIQACPFVSERFQSHTMICIEFKRIVQTNRTV